MPRRYPVDFRRKVLDLIEAGKPVAEIAAQLGMTAQTVYNWRNQDQIDRGIRGGVNRPGNPGGSCVPEFQGPADLRKTCAKPAITLRSVLLTSGQTRTPETDPPQPLRGVEPSQPGGGAGNRHEILNPGRAYEAESFAALLLATQPGEPIKHRG